MAIRSRCWRARISTRSSRVLINPKGAMYPVMSALRSEADISAGLQHVALCQNRKRPPPHRKSFLFRLRDQSNPTGTVRLRGIAYPGFLSAKLLTRLRPSPKPGVDDLHQADARKRLNCVLSGVH